MAKKAAKKGKRMADGGAAGVSDMMYREPGASPAKMPGRGMPAVEPGGNDMGRPATSPGRGRPSFMGGNPGRGRGRGIGGGRTNYPGIEGPGAGRGLGRPGTGMKPPSMGRPTTGGRLPPMQNMGPDRVDANTASPGVSSASVMPTPMGRGGSMGADTGLTPMPRGGAPAGGGMGASTGLTPTGGGTMTPNMNRDPSAVSAPRTGGAAGPVGMKMGMRGGGLARKGKGQALAKGGLVKGSGCAARGVKKAKYT